ncbi:hypothetical protein L873DRAFT_1667734 [Choiromyces venosus 120613-1]|uniref:CHAT domain-containing protein n=1 Tax=Choiromyces venosus 120613-1 TaxID=1336337 RepID=A0A3N4K771_9PEZI|nr:hypothetical protein L873DRAFT_1667734 [Choiromyces venosus 120613-1]
MSASSGTTDRIVSLCNWSATLVERFERLGDLNALGLAIRISREVARATPANNPSHTNALINLSVMFVRRFERIGHLDDLEQAIKSGEAAVAATPPDNPRQADTRNNLSNIFSVRFKRLGDLGDLQQAIKLGEAALAATPRNHPRRAGTCNNLGNKYSERFKRLGDLDDLQQAIKYSKAAVASMAQNHPDRATAHNSLGNMLFEKMGDINDLHQAIKHGEDALEDTPQDHPNLSFRCNVLGIKLQSRCSGTDSLADLSECLRLYREAWNCHISPPKHRIEGARRAAELLYSAGNFEESSSILEDAVNLMPRVNLSALKRDDRQYILAELSGLAARASSIALRAGREAYHSLKLLELGRGIIMGFTIDSRSEVSDLRADHPLEFDQFNRLRVETGSPIEETESASDETSDQFRNRTIIRRRKAVDEMEEVLARIHTLPGYTGFLLPPPQDALIEMATNGPIVVFNSTSYRSDAIIVTTSTITSLELPKLSYKGTSDWMKKLASFGGGGVKRGQDNRKMKELLFWLWDAAVGPVFDELKRIGAVGSEDPGDTNLKRIWWIGVGKLSMAPFHAAGDHSRGSNRNTLSRAISSYIPTIKALSYARQARFQLFDEYDASSPMESSEKDENARKWNTRLLVPMPKTPGATSLPGVDKEVKYICDSTPRNTIKTTVLNKPIPAKVLDEVRHHNIVHFACHGVLGINPSDSHLVLLTQDGKNSDKLLVRDISKVNTENAQLAYLSACSSAKNSSIVLADEAIHLASGFQLAGFSHVLANLWETDDRASSEVARDFYDLLFKYEGKGDGHHQVSATFHKAVKKVRDARPNAVLTWAPFVHTGA